MVSHFLSLRFSGILMGLLLDVSTGLQCSLPLKIHFKPTSCCCIAGAVTKTVGSSEQCFSCALRVQKLCMAFSVFSSVYCVYGLGEMKSRPCNPLKSVAQTDFG